MITNKLKNTFILLIMLGCYAIFFINSTVIADAIISTLLFCIRKLIPSIFPFMVLTSIFSQINFKPISYGDCLGINKRLFKIIVFSWLSGFIVGPKQLSNQIDEGDLTSYALLSSNAGVGFVISYVGIMLWGNIMFGIFLFSAQIITSFLIFRFSKKKAKFTMIKAKKTPLLTVVSNSVYQSANNMIYICAFTIFFVSFKQLLCFILKLDSQSNACIIISALTEISGGIYASVHSSNILLAGFFTGFCVGFGGICMCMQTFSVSEKCMINKLEFIIKKLIQGVACGVLSALYVKLNELSPIENVYLSMSENYSLSSVIINTIFLFTVLTYTKKLIKNKIYSI